MSHSEQSPKPQREKGIIDLLFKLPKWVLYFVLLAAASSIALVFVHSYFSQKSYDISVGGYQIVAVNQSQLSASANAGNVRVWRSISMRIDKDVDGYLIHSLNAVTDIVQVWSSSDANGPWDQVDGTLADGNIAEGIWIVDASDKQIRYWTGLRSPASVHGNLSQRNQWSKYGMTANGYNPNAVWFRFTAIAFCIEEGDCNE